MANQAPESLSDADRSEKPKFVLVQDTVPLPPTRKEIVKAFQEILNLGHVQKVTVELRKPIAFQRLVPENLIAEGQKPVNEDPFDAVRAGDLVDFSVNPKRSPYETLYDAFEVLSRTHQPKLIVAGNFSVVRKWLRLPPLANLDTIYGVKTAQSKDVPEDVIVLAGTDSAEPEQIVYSLRIPLEFEG